MSGTNETCLGSIAPKRCPKWKCDRSHTHLIALLGSEEERKDNLLFDEKVELDERK